MDTYEKKYNEALERARDYWETDNDNTLNIKAKGTMEYLFPELAESEDEKIKEALIQLVKCNERSGYFVLNNVSTGSMIAWLEKQINIIPDECVFRPLAGTDIKLAAKQAIEQQGVLAKEIVLAFNGAYIPVKGKAQDIVVNEYESWVEKQGEQNLANSAKPCDDANDTDEEIVEAVEQKNAEWHGLKLKGRRKYLEGE